MTSGLLARFSCGAFCALGMVLLAATPSWSGKSWASKNVALVIGNAAYKNAAPLRSPVNDAKQMAEMFRKTGYDVVDATYDADVAQFRTAVRRFADEAKDADIAVVYYSGHGIEINGVNYLIPVDARLASDWDADDELIPLDRVVAVAGAPKRLDVIILDASRDVPFARTMKHERPATAGVSAGFSAADVSNVNTLIAYAAKGGTVSIDDDGDHSVFTTALLENLFVPGRDLRIAFGRVRDQVMRQTSNREEPFVYGSLGGAPASLVPGSSPPPDTGDDASTVKQDFDLVEGLNSPRAWQLFLTAHPCGSYADLARERLAKLPAQNTADTAKPAAPTSGCKK